MSKFGKLSAVYSALALSKTQPGNRKERKTKTPCGGDRQSRLRAVETLESRQLLAADCIEFEDLPLSQTYSEGEPILADDTGLHAEIVPGMFVLSDGAVDSTGHVQVQDSGNAFGAGQELGLDRTMLNFDFPEVLPGVTFDFGEYGGNLNLDVNGDFQVFENFQDIHQTVIGGSLVSVVGGDGNDNGSVRISGPIESLGIGGASLWIDNVCIAEPIIDVPFFDFGDAPDSYGTTLGNSGPSHFALAGVQLGMELDAEFDGQPEIQAFWRRCQRCQ